MSRERRGSGRLAVGTPVGEAGVVAEDDACGDLGELRVFGGVDGVRSVGGPVVSEWGVEVELSLVDELEDGVGEDGFGERGGRETGVVGYGSVGGGIDGPEVMQPGCVAVLNECDGQAGNVGLLQKSGDVAGEGGDGVFGSRLLCMRQSGEEEGRGDGSMKHAFSKRSVDFEGRGFRQAKWPGGYADSCVWLRRHCASGSLGSDIYL